MPGGVSSTEILRRVVLGNSVSDKRASRKPKCVLCSAVRTARSIGYTGLSTSTHLISQNPHSANVFLNHRFWYSIKKLRGCADRRVANVSIGDREPI